MRSYQRDFIQRYRYLVKMTNLNLFICAVDICTYLSFRDLFFVCSLYWTTLNQAEELPNLIFHVT